MYLSHYNLSEMPFKISTDPRFLYLSNDHKEALANLKYGLQSGDGFVVLIGAAGTGKTTLVNALVETLDDSVSLAVINHPRMVPLEFLSFLVRTFDPEMRLNTKSDCLFFLKQFIEQSYAQNKCVLLIIDEAHRLADDLLEEIRLLSNLEQGGTKLLKIFFMAQKELKPRLLSTSNQALRQRITLFHLLHPLNEEDTVQYIRHRLNVAGCESQLFTARAIHAIYRYTHGYPRRINRLCDRALLTGYAKTRYTIDADIIHECIKEINLIDPFQSVFRPVHIAHQILWRWWDNDRMRQFRANAKSAGVKAIKRVGDAASELTENFNRIAVQGSARLRDKIASIDIMQFKRRYAVKTAALTALIFFGWAVSNYWPSGDHAALTTAKTPDHITEKKHHLTDEAAVQAEEETEIPAAYSPTLPKPVDREQAAVSSHATPGEPSLSGPGAPEGISGAQSIADLFETEKYQQVIDLFETGDGDPTTRSDQRTIYVKALIERAEQLKTQSPDQSAMLLSRAAAVDPENTEALVRLGNHLTRTGDYDRAVAVYEKALQHDEKLPDAHYNLGFIYASTGDYQKAGQALEQVVVLKPAYVDKALFNLAVVQQTNGNVQASLASLEAAVAHNPGNAKARAYLRELRQAQEVTP